MRKIYLSAALVATAALARAQNFEQVKDSTIKRFYYATAAVADFNNDKLPDVFFTGAVDTNADTNVDSTFNEFYTNVGGKFSISQSFEEYAVHLSDAIPMDFDNDGLMDVVTTGQSYDDIEDYRQYRWRNTGKGFELIKNTEGKIYGNLNMLDINHDGRQDFTQNGVRYENGGFVYRTELYTNTGTDFEHNAKWMPGTQEGEFISADLNNDGEYDALLYGRSDQGTFFTVYRNEGGTLKAYQTLRGFNGASLAVADFTGDGFLDFVIMGSSVGSGDTICAFINDGKGKFSEILNIDKGLTEGRVRAADLNNDGLYDFAVIGTDEDYNGIVKVFNYDAASKNFIPAKDTNLYQLGGSGDMRLADFDNDGKTDILMNGFDWADSRIIPNTLLYKNITPGENAIPTPPDGLSAVVDGSKIQFAWKGAHDDKTPLPSLIYEFSAGTQPGKTDLAKYNVTTDFWYLMKDKLPENFYWRIRTIDAAGRISEPSAEQSMLALATANASAEVFGIYPNPVSDVLHIKTSKAIDGVEIFDMAGKKMTVQLLNDKKSVSISSFAKGIYILNVRFADGNTKVMKVIKN